LTSSGEIPSGSTCVLDASVLLYAHQNASLAASLVLRRCAAADIIGILPSAVWEELCHRLMVAEAVATGRITGPNPARRLAEHPEIVRSLTAYRESIAELSAMGLRFEPVRREDVLTGAIEMQKRHGLLTNDSIIVACAVRLGVDYLITSDGGLAALTAVRIAFLDDINASA
jgi:predicted nucleic acid-binding protein